MHGFVKKGLLLSLAAGSMMASGAGVAAAADSAGAEGVAADSPGVGSGNVAQVPTDVPVKACGVTGSVVAVLTEAEGNDCINAHTSARAVGATANDPGPVSGEVVQASVNTPIQVCGDAVAAAAYRTGADDNRCVNR